MSISIIIPFYNESKNIPLLLNELHKVMESNHKEYEVILINDGSEQVSDISTAQLKNVRLFRHKKRLGKGEALRTGVANVKGDAVFFMDGDLQDDPHDIPVFLAKMEEGYDIVNGVRGKRKEHFLLKLYSKIANFVLHQFLHSPFTDINCGFKLFKREVLEEIPLYGNNFRFLPLAGYYRGYSVSEVPVNNRKRIHGVSKFGPGKIFVGLLDMLSAYFIFQFAERPLQFFGVIGGVLFSVGFFISLYLTIERVFFNQLLYRRPLLQFGILLIVIGIQIGMTGLMGELIVYQGKKKSAK